MLLQRIQQQFIDSADLKYQCAQALAPMVEAATAAVLASVTGGGKVLTWKVNKRMQSPPTALIQLAP